MRNHSRKACDASDREGLKISMSDGRHMGGKGLKMAKLASYDLWMFPKALNSPRCGLLGRWKKTTHPFRKISTDMKSEPYN